MDKAVIVTAPNEFQKPEYLEKTSIFLAGSIDNGQAPDWQKTVLPQLAKDNVLLLNPRRENWNAQSDDEQIRKQVNWELEALDYSDIIMMYIAEGSKAPISLLELGLYAHRKDMYLAVHPTFYRRVNVEEVCKKYDIPLYETLEELIQAVQEKLTSFN